MTKITRISFAVFSVGYLASLPLDLPLSGLLKILPILTLAIAVASRAEAPTRHFLLVALFFSGCGDLLLNIDQFIFGVAAFLLAQLAYGFLFKRAWQGLNTRWPISGFLSGYFLLVLYLLIPTLGSFLVPVLAYVGAIGFMGFAAIQSNYSIRWSVIGALIFILSDSLIAFDKFLQPIPNVSYAVMATYYLAQWMLIEGFIKKELMSRGK